MNDPSDLVVLLDESGEATGTASRASVHGPDTPLHLAFSCYVTDDHGRLLITRRALSKRAWPGVWSNSFCGHPLPAEPMVDAVRRRADFELGLTLADVELELPVFQYRATDPSGIVENEVCPVYRARSTGQLRPHPDEVMDHAWVSPDALGESIRLTPAVFSPWLVLQARLLPQLGGTPTENQIRLTGA